MTESKSREMETWIKQRPIFPYIVQTNDGRSLANAYSVDNSPLIRVVAYSEFEQLQKENELLKNKQEQFESTIKETSKMRDLYKSQLDVALDALKCNETFHRLGGIDDCDPCLAKLKIGRMV